MHVRGLNIYRILAVPPPGQAPSWPVALGRELGVPHLSLYALAQEEITRGSRLGELLSESFLGGDFVDDRLVEALLCTAATRAAGEGFVLSGIPLSSDLLARSSQLLGMTHCIATLDGLPRRVSRLLDPLRADVRTLDLSSQLADADVERAAQRFLAA